MNVGDMIKCHDPNDCINVMKQLALEGIETDFDYQDGLKLVVTKISRNGDKK